MTTNHSQKFKNLLDVAERNIKSGDFSEFSDIFLSFDLYNETTLKFAPEVLDILERIALSSSFMSSSNSDFLYADLIGFQHRLLPEQINRLLSVVKSTYEKVSSPQTCYAMADFVGTASPNATGFTVLEQLTRSADATKRECSLIGMYRFYEKCSDEQARAKILYELQRMRQDSEANVRAAAEHLLTRILRGTKQQHDARREGRESFQ